jgi:hypothetical protein
MHILGIDNGLDGGLVLLVDGAVTQVAIMPTLNTVRGRREYDVPALVQIVRGMRPEHVFIERAQSMPGQGVASMFATGHGFGLVCGIVAALGLAHTIVVARTWQKVMFRDLPKANTKVMAAVVCGRLWPSQYWRATERCTKAHTGLCDAALIAEYGRRQLESPTVVTAVGANVAVAAG